MSLNFAYGHLKPISLIPCMEVQYIKGLAGSKGEGFWYISIYRSEFFIVTWSIYLSLTSFSPEILDLQLEGSVRSFSG